MGVSLYPRSPTYTPENHPWRGQTFTGWVPGTYCVEGKPYCPTAWIVTMVGAAGSLAVMNTKEDCDAWAASCGASVDWPPLTVDEYREAGRKWEGAMCLSTMTEDDEEEKRAHEECCRQEHRMALTRHLFAFDDDGQLIGMANPQQP